MNRLNVADVILRFPTTEANHHTENKRDAKQHSPTPVPVLEYNKSMATQARESDQSGPLIGVLALQGAFEEHQASLEAVGCRTVQVRVVFGAFGSYMETPTVTSLTHTRLLPK